MLAALTSDYRALEGPKAGKLNSVSRPVPYLEIASSTATTANCHPAGHKCPRRFAFRREPAPVSGADKILKSELRRQILEQLERDERERTDIGHAFKVAKAMTEARGGSAAVSGHC